MTPRRAPARRDGPAWAGTPAPRPVPASLRRAARLFGAGLSLLAIGWLAAAAADVRPAPGGIPAAPAQQAGDEPPIPEPVGFVNDPAGRLDEATRARLEAFLDQLRRKAGAEFAVLIVPTTVPATPSEYKVRVFERWGLGSRERDDGLLMLVALEEREVRFETGYGLEGTLPDGLQSRIVRDRMAPRFREGDVAGGVTAGVLACAAILAKVKGVTLEWDGRELRYREGGGRPPLPVVLTLVALAIFLVMALAGAGMYGPGGRRRRRGGWFMGPGSFGGLGGLGGGGSFGGGFGGGSFGGFGGGASGGGGGGGRW